MSERTIKPLMKYDSDEDYLDERVALEESIKIWQYICDNELDEKCKHPNIFQLREYQYSCPLCEYYRKLDESSCKGCPLTFNTSKYNMPVYISCCNSSAHPWYYFANSRRYGIYGSNIMLRKMKLEYYRRYRETFNPYEDEKIL